MRPSPQQRRSSGRRTSSEPSALTSDDRYAKKTCGVESGLEARIRRALEEKGAVGLVTDQKREALTAAARQCWADGKWQEYGGLCWADGQWKNPPAAQLGLCETLLATLGRQTGGSSVALLIGDCPPLSGAPLAEARTEALGRDGLAVAVWLLLGQDGAKSEQTTFVRHGPDADTLFRRLYRWSGDGAPAPLPLLDTHVHFYDPSREGGVPWPPPENKLLYRTVQPEHLAELAGGWGVGGCIAVECSNLVDDNAKLLKLSSTEPLVRGVVGGGMEIGAPTFAADIEKFYEDPLFVGIRVRAEPFLGPKDDEGRWAMDKEKTSYLADLRSLEETMLALDVIGPATPTGTVVGSRGVLTPQHLSALAEVATRYPELRIIVNHTAGVPVNGAAPAAEWVEAMRGLAAHPHVYVKLSGHMEASTEQPAPVDLEWYRPLFDTLWEVFGPRRLL